MPEGVEHYIRYSDVALGSSTELISDAGRR